MIKNKVSIIIPTYKRADRIQRAVDSVLMQTYPNIEVIVVDDNNPETAERKETEIAMEKYKNIENLVYIKHNYNKNGSAARNTGIKNSNGEFVTFLDDDDEYYQNKIEAQVKCMNQLDETWAMCYMGYKKVDQYSRLQVSAEKSEGYIPVQVLSKNLFVGSGSNFLVRRKNILEINGFDESFERNQDLEFMSRILMNYKIKYIDEIGFLIHNEIREVRFTHEEVVRINNQYKQNFSKYFKLLNKNQQIQVEQLLKLNDLRFLIMYKKYQEAIKFLFKSKIPVRILIKYFLYLMDRIIRKKSYGFKL